MNLKNLKYTLILFMIPISSFALSKKCKEGKNLTQAEQQQCDRELQQARYSKAKEREAADTAEANRNAGRATQ